MPEVLWLLFSLCLSFSFANSNDITSAYDTSSSYSYYWILESTSTSGNDYSTYSSVTLTTTWLSSSTVAATTSMVEETIMNSSPTISSSDAFFVSEIVPVTSSMASSTDMSVSMTTSTPEPTGRVIQLSISITLVSVNRTLQQNIGQEIRDEFARQIGIDASTIILVVLIFIDENNIRIVVARISFNSRKRRQSDDSVTFNAIELDIQTTDESQAVVVQNMIDELSNKNNTEIKINGQNIQIFNIETSFSSLTVAATTSMVEETIMNSSPTISSSDAFFVSEIVPVTSSMTSSTASFSSLTVAATTSMIEETIMSSSPTISSLEESSVVSETVPVTSSMTSSTDVSVSMTTSTPEPTGRVIQLSISISLVSVNQTLQQNIGQEIRDEFARQIGIDSRTINRVVLILIDENNIRNVVARISFNSRKRRQSADNGSLTFNAIELDIQTTDESQAVVVQNMIDELSNKNNTEIEINGQKIQILNIETVVSPSVSDEPTRKSGLSNNAISGIILGTLLGVLIVTLVLIIIVFYVYRKFKSRSYTLASIEMSAVRKYSEDCKMPPE